MLKRFMECIDKKIKQYKYSTRLPLFTILIVVVISIAVPILGKSITNLHIIGTIFADMGDSGINIASENGLTEIVQKTESNNGVNITIDEVTYDGIRVCFSYCAVFKNNMLLNGDNLTDDVICKVNHMNIERNIKVTRRIISPYEYIGIVEIILAEEVLDQFKLCISFRQVCSVLGMWNFDNILVEKQSNIKTINLMLRKEIGISSIIIKKVKLSPITTEIEMESPAVIPSIFDTAVLKLTDERGSEIGSLGGAGRTENGVIYSTNRFVAIRNDVKVLKLSGYDELSKEKLFEMELPLYNKD